MTNRHSTPNGGGQVAVATKSAVRRITPVEAERLQALPDNWTLVPLRKTKSGKVVMMSDGARYKMIGNAFSSAPIRWIGERIAMVDAIASQEGAA